MSVLLEDMRVALLTLAPAGGVWYAINTTEPPVFPYITMLRVSSTPNVSLQGQSVLQNTRLQIDIYSRQISEAAAIETALESLMVGLSVTNVPLTSQDFYEQDVRAFRVSKDYSLWAVN